MTAPTRASKTASRPIKPEREQTNQREQTNKVKTDKPSTRTRSAAADRAYARREERRDRALSEGAERRPRTQRQSAEEPQRRRVVRPDTRARAKQLQTKVVSSRAPLVVAAMGLLSTGLVTTLWLSITAVSGSYELQQAEGRTNALNEQKALLLREVSNMDSTPALQRRAEELGLVSGPEPARLVQNPDGTMIVVGTPEEAKRPAPKPPPVMPPPSLPPNSPQPGLQQPAPQPSPEVRPSPETQRSPEVLRQASPVPAVEAR